MHVRVRVPATTANLGPGFDCLGMALQIYNQVTVRVNGRVTVEVTGEGGHELPRGEDNLVYQAFRRVYEVLGKVPPPIRILAENAIPLARGLGSSATAVIGGLLAANAMLGNPLSQDELLRLAWQIEGHPDNVVPALLGGCVVSVQEGGRLVWARVPIPPSLRAVLFVPNFKMRTQEARAVLPQTLSRSEAIFNISRAALLVAALATGELRHLAIATQDRIHQPARQALFPALPHLLEAALEAGALGAFLSGAGSTVLAFASGNEQAVALAMQLAAVDEDIGGQAIITRPSMQGAIVERE